MSKITEILNENLKQIQSANYQTHQIYRVLDGELDVLEVEHLEEIIEWMNENDLIGVSDAYEDLHALKHSIIFDRLRKELEKAEEIAHKRFQDEQWTLVSRLELFLELSAMIKVFRALADLQDTTIIKIDEEMSLSLSYFVNNLANDYNNYNISPKEVYDFIHTELNEDEEPEISFIINRIEIIAGKEIEHFVTVEKGVTAQHAYKRFEQKTDLSDCKILIKNFNNETLEIKYLS